MTTTVSGTWFLERTETHLWIGPEKAVGGKVGDVVTSFEVGPGYTPEHNEKALAHARLIAAAPELLECAINGWRMCNALILAAEQSGSPLPEDHYAVRDMPKFEAAIANAKSEATP